MAKKKVKKTWEMIEEIEGGTPRLADAELQQRLALRATQGEDVQEEEVAERIKELEEETTPEELEKELREGEAGRERRRVRKRKRRRGR